MDKRFERDGLSIEAMTVGPLATNCFMLACTKTNDAAIIDAGFDGKRLVAAATDNGYTITKILQTHAHIDHVAALQDVKAMTDAPIYLHPDDTMLYDAAVQQGMMFGYQIEPLPAVDQWLADGDTITIGELSARVQLLPGHSPGSVAFLFDAQHVAMSGDVLFAGSMGRVDLPGSSPDAMRASLDKVKTWHPETLVLSGHGPETTIEMELKRNPFLIQAW